MLQAAYCRYLLHFKQPAITSRAVMLDKTTYFVKIWDDDNPEVYGVGECALFKGLGADDLPDYEQRLAAACRDITSWHRGLPLPVDPLYSSIVFGLETALADLANGGRRVIFPSPWSNGDSAIPINGLVWMGNADDMLRRIDEKLAQGFRCVKMKIGGIDFDEELRLISYIRESYPASTLQLRLDANGAFTPDNALNHLDRLARYDIHSIEQPIKPRQWDAMSRISRESPIDIALDEELIGIVTLDRMEEMLDVIMPRYIILKPSLCGGFGKASSWISEADKRGIGRWVTSALESNVGLNAIAQWTATLDTRDMPQGLGTGALYTDNITSPLRQTGDVLRYDPEASWQIPQLPWKR